MAESVFELDGVKYMAGRLDSFVQLRVASIFNDAMMAYMATVALAEKQGKPFDELTRLQIISSHLSRIDDTKRESAIKICLMAVSRASGAGWAPVVARDGTMMFGDIPLSSIYKMVVEVLKANGIIDFFSVSQEALVTMMPVQN